MSTTPDTPQITPVTAMQWWGTVAQQLAVIAKQADDYLPNDSNGLGDDVLDSDAADEIAAAMVSARVAADTAYGATFRVARPLLERAQQQAKAQQVTSQQPQYAAPSWQK